MKRLESPVFSVVTAFNQKAPARTSTARGGGRMGKGFKPLGGGGGLGTCWRWLGETGDAKFLRATLCFKLVSLKQLWRKKFLETGNM